MRLIFATFLLQAACNPSQALDQTELTDSVVHQRRKLGIDLDNDGVEDSYSALTTRSTTPRSSSYQNYVNQVVKSYGCEEGYYGYDCAKRQCPYASSWNVNGYLSSSPSDEVYVAWGKQDGSTGVHAYEECAGKGSCNRDTGKCKCFEGFHGKGCRYKSCPNDCGEHGICQPAYIINDDYDADILEISQSWDRENSFRCECDYGYTGIDCSDRVCPQGLDPVNPHDCPSDIDETDEFVGADQQVVRFPTTMPDNQWFYLEFHSQFGGKPFRTHPINFQSSHLQRLAGDVQQALESLPNEILPSCQTRVLDNDADIAATILIAFTDPTVAGRQELLNCVAPSTTDADQCLGGSQPKILSINTDGVECETSYYNDASEIFASYECSSRGECDHSNGKCECHTGFEGPRCETMFSFY